MDLTVLTYLLYLLVVVPIVIWVGHTLFTSGKVFLVDVFDGNEDLADAVNRLLVVGFYLLNLGFVALYLRSDVAVGTGRGVLDALSVKVGVVLLLLGMVHLVNVWVFNRIRRRGHVEQARFAGPPAFAPAPQPPMTHIPAPYPPVAP